MVKVSVALLLVHEKNSGVVSQSFQCKSTETINMNFGAVLMIFVGLCYKSLVSKRVVRCQQWMKRFMKCYLMVPTHEKQKHGQQDVGKWGWE